MGLPEAAVLVAAAVAIGGLIGSVGIGGVLLVPFLTAIVGLGLREAVAIAMASYIATGLAAIVQARVSGGWTELRPYWPLIVATLPGAFVGGLAVAAVPETLALLALAAFLVATGGWTLRRPADRSRPFRRPGWVSGGAAGLVSAMTGTGGPAALMPLLLWRGVPLLAAIALGQVVQLPIALAATAGNLTAGPIAPLATLMVIAGLVPGVVIGRHLAIRLPTALMARLVAVLMIATGLLIALRAIL